MTKHWSNLLTEEFSKEYFIKLASTVSSERKYSTIYPKPDELFNVFNTDFIDVKVVILGQEPYFNGEGHGLAFSSKDHCPPGLNQIIGAIEDSIYNGLNLNYNTDLSYLAEQGVFLLNRILTVKKGIPLSHKNIGWEIFTNKVVESLNLHPYDIIYILAGKEAQTIMPIIDPRHHVIEVEHPAYASMQNRNWQFEDCFNKANVLLENQGRSPIKW